MTQLNKDQLELLDTHLQEAFEFLAKDKKQEDIPVAEFVHTLSLATEQFLERLQKKDQRRSGPILLVPDYVAKEKGPN